MKKKDLKTGMLVELEYGLAVVMLDHNEYGNIISYEKGGYDSLKGWDENLVSDFMPERFNINKVYTSSPGSNGVFNKDKLLWERKEEKPLFTLDGVEYSEETARSIIKKAHGC